MLQTASGRNDTYARELDGTWSFGGKEITIPHTWNAIDGEDGRGFYERTAYWYHKAFDMDCELTGKRVYIEFLGANTKTEVYVNMKKQRNY